jgi:ankyrin repeat protein
LLLATTLTPCSAQTNSLTSLLQKGLFEEQASRDLDAAIVSYQTLAAQFDKDRQLAATAVFRLGECYRAQGKTNEAAVQYQRILRDFSDQQTLAILSRQNLAGMGAAEMPALATRQQQQKELLVKQIAQAEERLAGTKQLFLFNKATQSDVLAAENQVFRLQQQLAAVDSSKPELYRTDLPELSAPAESEEDKAIARIKEMIKNSPDLINGNPIQGSPLGRATEAGQLRVATFLLDNGADVNAPHFTAGHTALIVAAQAGQKAMVELLLKRGAEINTAGSQGQTALHQAVSQGFIGVAQVLLDAKADPNLRNDDMETPLTIAAKKGSRSLVALLLTHGADPNAAKTLRSGYGKNPIEQGRKMFGTPLHIAAARGDAEMVALLLTNRADVKALSIYDETPLQAAAACGKADVVELMLKAGANPDARSDSDAGTPLHLAISNGSQDVVEKLLAHGANPNATAKFGRLGVTPLMLAAGSGNDGVVSSLIQHKANVNQKDIAGESALIYAIKINSVAVVKTLLAHGADPNAKVADGLPALFRTGRSPEIAAALIEAHADVNAVAGDSRQTLLHGAAADGNTDIVKLLLNAKANVNARDVSGETPLHSAVRSGKDDIVALLLDAKADPNARNNYGVTPLDLAKNNRTSGSLSGGVLTINSSGTLALPGSGQPLTYQWRNDEQTQSNAPVSIADLLRQHGALDELPDFTRIRITRQGLKQPLEVFQAGANLTNQFTLLETVMRFYSREIVWIDGRGRAAWESLPFPDFGRIIIRRPSPKIGGKETEIKVSLLNRSNVVDCAKDVPLQFGDVIEIPESVHALNASVPNPVQEMETDFKNAQGRYNPGFVRSAFPLMTDAEFATLKANTKAAAQRWTCLQKTIQLVVAGETTSFKVNSWREGFLSQALGKTEARSVLRSSSDLSRVKVSRQTGKPAKPLVFIVDAAGNGAGRDDLWLQDGDVIEVPEKN